MKVNITTTGELMPSPYVNISGERTSGRKYDTGQMENIVNLNNIDDGAVDEIYIKYSATNMLTPHQFATAITNWRKKLKDDGMVYLSFIDSYEVFEQVVNGSLKYEHAHNLLYGEEYQNRVLLCYATVQQLLKQLGFKIITCGGCVDHVRYLEVQKA